MATSSVDGRDAARRLQRRGLAVGSGLVAVSAYLGTLGLARASGPAGRRLDARLPFGSRRLACAALVAVVALPHTVVAWYAWRGNRHTSRGPDRPAVEGEIEIHRPPEVVFDTVADERNEPRYNPRLRSVTKATTRPVGRGTRFRAGAATVGRTVPMSIELTEYTRPHRLGSHTRMKSMDVRGTLTFEPTERGTRMRWRWQLEPHGVLRRAGPLVARVGSRQEQRIWGSLKRYLEADPT
jgi:uncharacterized protein YndB with AHSA1/START domain